MLGVGKTGERTEDIELKWPLGAHSSIPLSLPQAVLPPLAPPLFLFFNILDVSFLLALIDSSFALALSSFLFLPLPRRLCPLVSFSRPASVVLLLRRGLIPLRPKLSILLWTQSPFISLLRILEFPLARMTDFPSYGDTADESILRTLSNASSPLPSHSPSPRPSFSDSLCPRVDLSILRLLFD